MFFCLRDATLKVSDIHVDGTILPWWHSRKLNTDFLRVQTSENLKNREHSVQGSRQRLSSGLTFDQWRMALEQAQYAEMKHNISLWHSSLSGR